MLLTLNRQFIKYFYEIWNGGMELFTQRDFDNTIKAFLELARQQRSATGNSPKKAVPAGKDLRQNDSERKKKLGEVSHVSLYASLSYMTSCHAIVQVFDAFDLDGDGAVSSDEFSLLAKIKRKITGDTFLVCRCPIHMQMTVCS